MSAEPGAGFSGDSAAAGAAPVGFRKVGERRIHDGVVFGVVDSTFASPDGRLVHREVVRHIGAVAVVPVEGSEVVLVRQFRVPVEEELLEVPAGRRDVAGEAPEDTARRELAEEAGLGCSSLVELGSFYNSPGFCDELSYVYLASDLHPVPRQPDGAEEEWMTTVRVPIDAALEMIDRGAIRDAKTIIGLMLAARRMSR